MKTEKKLYSDEKPKNKTVYHIIDKIIKSKYEIRFNMTSHDYEIRLKGYKKWHKLNLESLMIELETRKIKASYTNMGIYLKSYFVDKYDPIKIYFEKLPEWDKEDHIKKYAGYVPMIDQEQFAYHFKKWLVRAVRCALEPLYINKQCIVLVHPGQNSGKSSWCRHLCPNELKNYYTEDLGYGKDANIQLAKNFLIAFDDLEGEKRNEISQKKALMSKQTINERLPYDRNNTVLPRRSSFIGSTNNLLFLKDETGSVRWLGFEMNGNINFNYREEVDLNQVWSQAYYLAYNDKNFQPELTREDIRINEKRNSKYRELTPEEEIITKYYEHSSNKDDFITATEVVNTLNCLNIKLNTTSMGKALTSRKFTRIKCSKRQVYGYLAKPLFLDSPWEIK